MKIEKITLCNLTSIEGEHIIDFTKEPLRSASLFAITGDTGAGKSTLLDAICLALYNRAPRFDNAERVVGVDLKENMAGAAQLQTNDVRQILRRGQKEAYSKVEFSTPDGATYEAVWYLRVKRTGTYDTVTRSLQRLSPKKEKFPEKEIDQHVVRILGLDYLQFTRTVMLAQNSFSNFLKAKRGEKSALLEKLTGTEIYGHISQTIYQQCEQAKREAAALENELKGVFTNRLAPEDLQEVNSSLSLLRSSIDTATGWLQVVDRQLQWYADNAKSEEVLRRCEQEYDAAHKAYVAMRADELRLERYDDVLCVQPLHQEILVRREDIAALKEQEEQIFRQVEEQRRCVEKTGAALEGLLGRSAEAEQRLVLRRPYINRGHALNGEISEAQEQLRKKEEELDNAKRVLAQRQSQLEAKNRAYESMLKKIEQYQLHQQGLAVHRLMFERFDLMKDKLTSFNTESRLNAENHKKALALQKRQQELAAKREEIEHRQQRSQERLSALKGELMIHLQTNQGHDSHLLQQRFADCRSRLVSLEHAAALWQRISLGYEEISEKKAARSRHLSEQEQLKKEIERAKREVEVYDEAYRHLNVAYTLSQSENIVQLRQQLKEGSACPVCGATHHPYHTETERELGELLSNLEKEFTEAEEQLRLKKEALADLREKLAAGDGRIHAETENLEERERQQVVDVEEWKTCAYLDTTFRDCSESVNRNARRLTIEMLSDSTRRAVEEAEKELETFNFHQQQINTLNEQVNALNARIADDQSYLEDLRTQHKIATASLDELQHTLQLSDRTCSQLYTDLDEIITLSGWFTEWRNNADTFRMRLSNMYQDWQATSTNLDECQRSAAILEEEIRSAETNRTDAVQQMNRYGEILEQAAQVLQNKRMELKQLFGESSPEKEEEYLQQQIHRARANEGTARAAAEAAANRLNQLQGTQRNLLESRLKKQKEYNEKMSEMDMWILRFNGDHSLVQLQELSQIFADNRDWNALRRRIDERKRAVELSLHSLEAARQEWQRVQSAPVRPNSEKGESLGELQAGREEQLRYLDELRDKQSAANMKLLAHERSLKVAAGYEEQLNKARHNAEQWERLSSLFGSADGKRFRELAQSYTFSYLVEHANCHLRQLSPRYELRTLPGTLTLEIIDRDMFDQCRYVHSLSGGETFVVSLSLALGLSSLSGNSLAIGSLFIDEGFGNLDEESLQLVMDALSRLESTQGRKVGVISHTSQIRSQISPQIHLVKLPGSGRSRIEIR